MRIIDNDNVEFDTKVVNIRERRIEIAHILIKNFEDNLKNPAIDSYAFMLALIDVLMAIGINGKITRTEFANWVNESILDSPENIWPKK